MALFFYDLLIPFKMLYLQMVLLHVFSLLKVRQNAQDFLLMIILNLEACASLPKILIKMILLKPLWQEILMSLFIEKMELWKRHLLRTRKPILKVLILLLAI